MREPFNGLSHLAGVFLSLVALSVLLVAAWGRPRPLIGVGLFGASLIAVYLASTLYHSLRVSGPVYDWLGRFDYIAIFLLIAGTYAPLCLVTLHGAGGGALLCLEYGLALAGILGVLLWKGMPDWLRIVLYLFMGSLIVPLLPSLRPLLPKEALAWLLGGGLVYMVGVAVFIFDLPGRWRGRNLSHGLWHLFVLGGSACHFVLVLRYIVPPA